MVLVAAAYLAALASVGVGGSGELRFAPDAEAVSLPTFEGGTHAARYQHGGTLSFSFPLENTGLVPITVTGVRLSDRERSMLAVEAVALGSDQVPARLGAGDAELVHVTARYDSCRYYHERELESFPGATVEASALGVDLTRTVDFDHPLVVRSPMIVDCPDRTLARDDHVRR